MKKQELVILPLPGVGHLISTVELAKRFHETQHHFSITILLLQLQLPSTQSKITSYIQSVAASHSNIRFVNLPSVNIPFEDDMKPLTFISLLLEESKSHVKEAIQALSSSSPSSCSSSSSTHVVGLIIDMFATSMIDVGMELSIPTYIYYASNAASLGLLLYMPTLHAKIPCEYKEYNGEVEVPGMLSLPPAVLPTPFMDRKDDDYTWYAYHGRRFREASGLIVNTFAELETRALKAIVDGEFLPDHHSTPPIYPVGPIIALTKESQPQPNQSMEWLDQQPPSSVVFLCFGSMGTFSVQQIKAMALGLEHGRHRFLWSIRCHSSAELDLDKVLPIGFLDRTRDWGLVLQSWVPQVDILSHEAVGGFVSHCGWNSTLESIWFGVPMLAWPLYAEQRHNAFQLVREYGLAVELKLDYEDYEKDGWVSAEELEKGVRCLMGDSKAGQSVRKKVKEIAEASKKAVEGGGSSFSTLELLGKKLME